MTLHPRVPASHFLALRLIVSYFFYSMSLHLIATPIGNRQDITLRAIDALKNAEIVIGEERREVSRLLKSLGISDRRLELLNEHSKPAEVRALAELCREHAVALVTDCGTPGFCDPGARLVAACRSQGIATTPLPGASSLMCLLSVTGHSMQEFLFRGFLPTKRDVRGLALRELAHEKRPVILMDTPYRMGRLLAELAERFPERRALLGCDFTQESETIVEAHLKDLPGLMGQRKAEFILAVFPNAMPDRRSPRSAGRASKHDSGRALDRPSGRHASNHAFRQRDDFGGGSSRVPCPQATASQNPQRKRRNRPGASDAI